MQVIDGGRAEPANRLDALEQHIEEAEVEEVSDSAHAPYVTSLHARIASATDAAELDEIERLIRGSDALPEDERAGLDAAVAGKRREVAGG